MSADNSKELEDLTQKYLALGSFQIVIGVTLIACPTISIIATSDEQLPPGHIYALSAMTLVQGIANCLVYYYGRKMITDCSKGRPCGCCISIGIFIGFPEFATIIAGFVVTGLYIANDVSDQTNRIVAYVAIVFCGLALIANILTIYFGCTKGSALGVNFNRGQRQVRNSHTTVITTTRSYGMQNQIPTADHNARVHELQIQNSLLQQQILLQQQQQLNDQQRYNNYGFQPPPPANYAEGLDPAYPPPPYPGPPPPYNK